MPCPVEKEWAERSALWEKRQKGTVRLFFFSMLFLRRGAPPGGEGGGGGASAAQNLLLSEHLAIEVVDVGACTIEGKVPG